MWLSACDALMHGCMICRQHCARPGVCTKAERATLAPAHHAPAAGGSLLGQQSLLWQCGLPEPVTGFHTNSQGWGTEIPSGTALVWISLDPASVMYHDSLKGRWVLQSWTRHAPASFLHSMTSTLRPSYALHQSKMLVTAHAQALTLVVDVAACLAGAGACACADA